MARFDRRSFLKLSGSGALAATGGMAGILASGRGPAYAQATSIHGLRGTDFVPASDQLLKGEIVAECEKALGMKLTIETINANDIQARITSSVQSGSGPDIVCALNNWAQLCGESLADVTDVAEELGKAQGGFYETSKVVANDGKRWIAVPWSIVGLQIAYRKSWFEEVGYSGGKFPETWEALREAGKKLKAMGRPVGQTLGHTFGDAPAFTYPYLWSWGAKEFDADGKSVLRKGQGGQFSFHVRFSNMLMGYSKNQKGAKEFLRWISSKPVFDKWFTTQKGFSVGPTTDWEKHKLWNDDPIMLPYRSAARTGRFAGYAGPSRK